MANIHQVPMMVEDAYDWLLQSSTATVLTKKNLIVLVAFAAAISSVGQMQNFRKAYMEETATVVVYPTSTEGRIMTTTTPTSTAAAVLTTNSTMTSVAAAAVDAQLALVAPWRRTLSETTLPRQFALDNLYSLRESHGIGPAPNAKETAPSASAEVLLKREICKLQGDDDRQCFDLDKTAEMRIREDLLIMHKCTSYTTERGHAWYAATWPKAGTLFALVNDDNPHSLQVEQIQTIETDPYEYFYFLVPFKSPPEPNATSTSDDDDERPKNEAADALVRLAKSIRNAIEQVKKSVFGTKMLFRLFVSRWRMDWALSDATFRNKLSWVAGRDLQVVLSPCSSEADAPFHRAHVANCLIRNSQEGECGKGNCILSLMDVDMQVGPSFIFNSLSFVKPATSVYFPIVFTEFNPETVKLVSKVSAWHKDTIGETIFRQGEDHYGIWRPYGSGMWSMAASDAFAGLQMNESFTGWGGEDNDFYKHVASKRHVVRMQEPGLNHVWHPKICQESELSSKFLFNACRVSQLRAEGMAFGVYLKMLSDDPDMAHKIGKKDTKKENKKRKKEDS